MFSFKNKTRAFSCSLFPLKLHKQREKGQFIHTWVHVLVQDRKNKFIVRKSDVFATEDSRKGVGGAALEVHVPLDRGGCSTT